MLCVLSWTGSSGDANEKREEDEVFNIINIFPVAAVEYSSNIKRPCEPNTT